MLNCDCLLQKPCEGCSSKHHPSDFGTNASVSPICFLRTDYCYDGFTHIIVHKWNGRLKSIYCLILRLTKPAHETDLPVVLETHLQTATLISMCQICATIQIRTIILIQILLNSVTVRKNDLNLHRSLAPTPRVKAQCCETGINEAKTTNSYNAKLCNYTKIIINPIPTGVFKLRVGVLRLGSKTPVGMGFICFFCKATQFGIIWIGITGFINTVSLIWHLEFSI